ncbi:MAG: hypothetical protein QG609_541 [Patescibacteria group bacterium]|nr:hypothetical protein [Patescibacteria group bacterium]MDQ5957807.1 hypothetical protein [Patescibacteria group bacterium]
MNDYISKHRLCLLINLILVLCFFGLGLYLFGSTSDRKIVLTDMESGESRYMLSTATAGAEKTCPTVQMPKYGYARRVKIPVSFKSDFKNTDFTNMTESEVASLVGSNIVEGEVYVFDGYDDTNGIDSKGCLKNKIVRKCKYQLAKLASTTSSNPKIFAADITEQVGKLLRNNLVKCIVAASSGPDKAACVEGIGDILFTLANEKDVNCQTRLVGQGPRKTGMVSTIFNVGMETGQEILLQDFEVLKPGFNINEWLADQIVN